MLHVGEKFPVSTAIASPGHDQRQQDVSDGSADAGGGGLAGDAETDDQLRVRARLQPDPDEVAQLRQLERLAVQGRGHAAGGGAEQDPLQGLPGRHPVGWLVRTGRQQAHGPGRPLARGRGGQSPAFPGGEVTAQGSPARCARAIRNYDPCISCSAHFLDLTVDRSLRTERAGLPAPAPDLGPGDQGRRLLAFRHPAG
jgi:hypothetical protein